MFMCVTVCTKLTLSVTDSSAAGLRRVEKERDQVKGEEMAQLCYRGIDSLLTSPQLPPLLQLRVAVSAS